MKTPAGRLAGVALALALVLSTTPRAAQQVPAAAQAVQSQVVAPAPEQPRPPFGEWLAALRQEALARGITAKTVESALANVEPLAVIVERDRTQAELTLTFNQYLKRRLTAAFVKTGRKMARTHAGLLRQVAAKYGVGAGTLVAIWGMESNYGRFSGTWPTIAALATLAYDPHRPGLFRNELFAALEILDRQDIRLDILKGSWAGAMGQPQFMPSSYLRYAVDFDEDGQRNIWSSTGDVFASIANFLKEHGWTPGVRWGREVKVDEAAATRVAEMVLLRVTGSCQAIRQMTESKPIREWRTLGVRQINGAPLPGTTLEASLVRVDSRTFLVYSNYEALLGYNCAHAYALGVGVLADRIGGGN
ncbi:MAG: lytic murein transglycosylase [Acidobacteria bacterium]|nr:lytic murein transglycosylase [Acidobacteriota bacterium]